MPGDDLHPMDGAWVKAFNAKVAEAFEDKRQHDEAYWKAMEARAREMDPEAMIDDEDLEPHEEARLLAQRLDRLDELDMRWHAQRALAAQRAREAMLTRPGLPWRVYARLVELAIRTRLAARRAAGRSKSRPAP